MLYKPMLEEYELREDGQIIVTNARELQGAQELRELAQRNRNKLIGSVVGGLVTGATLGGPIGAIIGVKLGLISGMIGFVVGYGVVASRE